MQALRHSLPRLNRRTNTDGKRYTNNHTARDHDHDRLVCSRIIARNTTRQQQQQRIGIRAALLRTFYRRSLAPWTWSCKGNHQPTRSSTIMLKLLLWSGGARSTQSTNHNISQRAKPSVWRKTGETTLHKHRHRKRTSTNQPTHTHARAHKHTKKTGVVCGVKRENSNIH